MYKFQPKPELIWALVVTAATTLAQFATAADPAVVLADPRTWLVSAAAAVVRAVLALVLAKTTPATGV